MVVEWQEDRRDARDRLKVVHTDVGVGNRETDRLLGKRDQLEHLEGIEQLRCKQRRVRIDTATLRRDLVIEPNEHLVCELLSPAAHAATLSTVCPQPLAIRARSIGFQ
jgi:hypothetical protein